MLDFNDKKALLNRLKELDFIAESLNEKRNILNAEAKKWADRRDALNQRKNEVQNQIKNYRNKRDAINSAVKALKESRIEIVAKINVNREECAILIERVKARKIPKSGNSIKHKIDKLNWTLQTNVLSLVEEKKIIDYVRVLEEQLLIHKKIATFKERITELNGKFSALKIKKERIHSQLIKFTTKSQDYHNKMLKEIEIYKPLNDKADNFHHKYLESKEALSEMHKQYLETIDQIKMVDTRIKKIEDAEYNKQLDQKINEVSKEAYKKFKDKKKVTLDEFKILKKKALI